MSDFGRSVAFRRLGTAALVTLLTIGSIILVLDTERACRAVVAIETASPLDHSPSSPYHPLSSLGYALILLMALFRTGRWLKGRTWEEQLGLGAVIFMILPPILNLFLPLKPGLLILVTGSLAILQMPAIFRNRPHKQLEKIRDLIHQAPRYDRALILLGMTGLAWAFAASMALPSGMDALVYHLGLGMQYLLRGNLIPPDATVYYQYFQGGEMLSLVSLAFDPSGVAANIIAGLFLPAAAFSAARAAGEWLEEENKSAEEIRRGRCIAWAVTATCPLAILLVANTKPDLLSFALFTIAMRCLTARGRAPMKAAFLLGGSLAAKMTALYGVLPAALWICWGLRKEPRRFLLASLLLSLPSAWWVGSNVFRFGHLLPQGGHVLNAIMGLAGIAALERIARIFAATTMLISAGLDGPYGPAMAVLFIALIPVILRPRHRLFPAAAIAFSAAIFWFVTGGGSHQYAQGGIFRFVLPAFGAVIPAGAVCLAGLTMAKGNERLIQAALRAALILAMVSSLFVSFRVLTTVQPFVSLLAGRITDVEYMERWLSSYRLQRFAATHLPEDAVVLSIGEANLFTLRRRAFFDADADLPRALQMAHDSGHDSEKLADLIEALGVTHILYAPDWYAVKIMINLAPPPPCPRDREILERYLDEKCQLFYSDNAKGCRLYALSPLPG